jgi:hypothetical protein
VTLRASLTIMFGGPVFVPHETEIEDHDPELLDAIRRS